MQEEAEGYRAAEAAIAAALESADQSEAREEKPDADGQRSTTDEAASLRQQVKSLRALLYRVSRAAAASGMEPALWMDGSLVRAAAVDTRRIEEEARDTRRQVSNNVTEERSAAGENGAAALFHEGTDALAMHRARLDRRLLGPHAAGSASREDGRTRDSPGGQRDAVEGSGKPADRKPVARETLPRRGRQSASGSLGGVVGWIVSPPVILARVLATAADAVFGEEDDADDPLAEPSRPVLEL